MGDRTGRDPDKEKEKEDDRHGGGADPAKVLAKLEHEVEQRRLRHPHLRHAAEHLRPSHVAQKVTAMGIAVAGRIEEKGRTEIQEHRSNHNVLDADETIRLVELQVETLEARVSVIAGMRDRLTEFEQYEMITDSFAGISVSVAIGKLQGLEKLAQHWADNGKVKVHTLRLVQLSTTTMSVEDEAHNYPKIITDENEKLSASCEQVLEDLRKAVNVQAVRAVIDAPENGKKYQTYRRTATVVTSMLDQFVNAAGFTGDILTKIPEPHTQMAARVLGIAVEAFRPVWEVSKYIVQHVAGKADEHTYVAKQPLGLQFRQMDANPLAAAEMLAQRRAAQVNLLLTVVCDTVANQIAELCPMSSAVSVPWKVCHRTILGCVEKYEQKRIAVATAMLTGIKDHDSLGEETLKKLETEAERAVREEIEGTLRTNLVGLLQPLELATDITAQILANEISTVVVELLNAPPAQPVTGTDLQVLLERVKNAQVRAPVGEAAPTAGPTCPETTNGTPGIPVRRVLSPGTPVEDRGLRWLVVLETDAVGHLYSEPSGLFEPATDGGGVPAWMLSADLPAAVYGTETLRLTSATGPAADQAGRRWPACIGPVRGFVEETGESLTFTLDTAAPVQQSAFANWRDRFVYPPGTDSETQGYELRTAVGDAAPSGTGPSRGATVTGTWHRMPGSEHRYLFAAADGTLEWATGIDNTGNGASMDDVMADRVPPLTDAGLAALLKASYSA